MADHRRTSALRRLLARLSLRGTSRTLRLALLIQFATFGVGAPLLLILEGHAVGGLILAIVSFAGSIADVWLAAERQRMLADLCDRRSMLDEYEAALQNLQAVTPDGAPTRAYWAAHCGCTHVQVWDGEGWVREHVAQLNPHCPLAVSYGPVGGHGV